MSRSAPPSLEAMCACSFIGEQESIESVHEALVTHSALAIMQSSAARIGMMAKTRHDERTVRWKKENPLRVRDVVSARRSDGMHGVCEPL